MQVFVWNRAVFCLVQETCSRKKNLHEKAHLAWLHTKKWKLKFGILSFF